MRPIQAIPCPLVAALGLFIAVDAGAQGPVFADITVAKATATEALNSIAGTNVAPALRNGGFRVSLSAASKVPVTVGFTVSGTATNGTDYTAIGNSVTIPAGQTTADIVIVPTADVLPERDETVVVRISGGTGYALPTTGISGTVTIIDDDQLIQFSVPDAQAAEPGVNTGRIQLDRMGSITNRLALPLVFQGNAANGIDVTALPDSAIFPAGQSTISFTITPRPDNDAEGQESFRLLVSGAAMQPSGGGVVNIIDAVVTLTTNIPSVVEAAGASANLVITRSGDLTSSAVVSLTTSGSATKNVDYTGIPNSVTFAAGAASVTVPIGIIADQTPEGAETVVVSAGTNGTLALGQPGSATLVIDEAGLALMSTFSLSAGAVLGGASLTGTVQLNSPAPSTGFAVALSLAPATATGATLSTTTLLVPAGAQSATFTITTVPVPASQQVTVTATPSTGSALSRSFSVAAPLVSTFAVNRSIVTPQAVRDSTSVNASLTLSGPAPAGGMPIALASSDAALIVSSPVVVPAGQTSANIKVTVLPVAAPTSATLTTPSGRSATVTINPPAIRTVSIAPASIVGQVDGRALAQATIALDGPPAPGGITVALAGNGVTPAVSSLSMTNANLNAQVAITAAPVNATSTGTLTATFGSTSVSGTVTINPPGVSAFTTSPDSGIGGTVVFRGDLQLSAPAPANFSVPASVSSSAAFLCSNGNPVSGIVASSGQRNVPFSLCTRSVASRTSVAVDISGVRENLVVLPTPPIANIVMSHSSVVGGNNAQEVTATIVLSAPQAQDMSFQVASNNTHLLAGAGTQSIPAGNTTLVIPLRTVQVPTTQVATIVASNSAITLRGSLTLQAPAVQTISMPSITAASTTLNANLALNGKAPQGYAAQLTSSSSVVTVPAIVGFLTDSTNATFQAQVGPSASDVPVTITAQTPGGTRTLQLTVRGSLAVQGISVSPTQLIAGDSATGTLALTSAAPAGGFSAPISAVASGSTTAPVQVPATVTVPAGQTSTTFPVRVPMFGGSATSVTLRTGPAGFQISSLPFSVTGLNFQINGSTSVISGTSALLTLSIPRPAPQGGYTIAVSSPASFVAPPSSVTIPEGQLSATATIGTSSVSSTQFATLTFTFGGFTQNRQLAVQTRSLTMTANPQLVTGGNTVTVTISSNAPAGAAGDVIALSTPPGMPITLPASITLPSGATQTSFVIGTTAVTSSIVVPVTATLGPLTASINITVQP